MAGNEKNSFVSLLVPHDFFLCLFKDFKKLKLKVGDYDWQSVIFVVE